MLLLLWSVGTNSFTVNNVVSIVGTGIGHRSSSTSSSTSPLTPPSFRSSSSLFSARDGYFQLEEREDADMCITEIYCKGDGTVEILDTDGPIFTKASGSWKEELATNRGSVQFGRSQTRGTFTMSICRSYPAGHDKTLATDMGNFDYDVVRYYKGEYGQVGGKLNVSGKIFKTSVDEQKYENEIGYFELLDTTEDIYTQMNALRRRQEQETIRIVPLGE